MIEVGHPRGEGSSSKREQLEVDFEQQLEGYCRAREAAISALLVLKKAEEPCPTYEEAAAEVGFLSMTSSQFSL